MSERVHPASAREVAARLSDAGLDEIDELLKRYGGDPRKQVQHAVAAAKRRRDRETSERDRVSGMYDLQRELGGDGIVLGVDEVGRAPLQVPLRYVRSRCRRIPEYGG